MAVGLFPIYSSYQRLRTGSNAAEGLVYSLAPRSYNAAVCLENS